MITAAFLIEAEESRIIAAIEAKLERAFEHEAARKRLNVSHRQPVVCRPAQAIERVNDFQQVTQTCRRDGSRGKSVP